MKRAFNQLGTAWKRHAAVRWTVGLAAGWFVLCKSSSGVTEAIGYLTGLWALWNWRRTVRHWKNPVGVCFGLGVLWAVASVMWSPVPSEAGRNLLKTASLVFGVWGLPAVFAGRDRVRTALAAGAGLLSVRLAADLVRLAMARGVGRELLYWARYEHPYLFNHPNVSCMMAGLAALAWVALATGGVRGGWRKAGLLAGLAVDLAYLVVMASRGPQIVFVAALLAYPLMALPGWKARVAAIAAVAALGTGLWLGAGRINPRMKDSTMGGFHGRDVVWKHVAEHLMPEHPLRGFGFGKGTFEHVTYHDSSRKPLRGEVEYPHAHSYWLMLVFQGGFIALILWLEGWFALLAGLLLTLHHTGLPPAPWRWRLADRAMPAFFLAAIGMVLLYGVADYPDNLIRDVQFMLPALALAWAWPPRGAERAA